MAELPEKDAALLLDMLLAARDAQSFVRGLDESAFLASRLHQIAAIRCATVSFTAIPRFVSTASGWRFAMVWTL